MQHYINQIWMMTLYIAEPSLMQFYVNPCTAAGMLDVLQVPKGEWLLQSAAGSVLGRQVRSCPAPVCKKHVKRLLYPIVS